MACQISSQGVLPIDVVHLIEVDVVRLQPPEAGVTGVPDVTGRELRIVGPVAGDVAVDLGGQDHLLPPAATLCEPAAEDLLGELHLPP